MHADLWRAVGGFDEDYFLYWEDVDLSLRLLRAGAALEVRHDLEVVHDVGATSHDRAEGKSAVYFVATALLRDTPAGGGGAGPTVIVSPLLALMRNQVDAAARAVEEKFAETPAVPPPPHWGGYRVRPETVEFWQGRQDRMHDRIRFDLVQQKVERLAP